MGKISQNISGIKTDISFGWDGTYISGFTIFKFFFCSTAIFLVTMKIQFKISSCVGFSLCDDHKNLNEQDF